MLPRLYLLLSLLLSSTAAMADRLATDRPGTLVGEERPSLAAVPPFVPTVTEIDPAATWPEEVRFDPVWIAGLPAEEGGEHWHCLAEALYFEARGESVRGQFAVGEVILNRVETPAYPGTVCDVVDQGTGRLFACQFTYNCDGVAETIAEPAAFVRVGKVARLLLDGAPRDLTDGATHYHTRAVNPSWADHFPRTATVGHHHFYREPVRTASN